MAASSTIPDSDAHNWIIAPAARCVRAVAEGARVGGLLQKAVIALANQGPLLQVAQRAMESAGIGTGSILQLRAQQQELQVWAEELIDGDLHELHTSGIVALWTSLEVAVEDTAVLILLRDPTAVALLSDAGVRLPAGVSSPPTETDARRIFVRFDRLAAGTRSVAEAYCHVLGTLGLAIDVDSANLDKLNELNYVRNCVLHRGGIVDDRVAVEAPLLGVVAGGSLRIGQASYLAYFDAVKVFVLALIDAALNSRHVRVKSSEASAL